MTEMDGLTLFGLFAVTSMLICYALEDRSHWLVLAFAGSWAKSSKSNRLNLGIPPAD